MCLLHHFVFAKLATSSIKVRMYERLDLYQTVAGYLEQRLTCNCIKIPDHSVSNTNTGHYDFFL